MFHLPRKTCLRPASSLPLSSIHAPVLGCRLATRSDSSWLLMTARVPPLAMHLLLATMTFDKSAKCRKHFSPAESQPSTQVAGPSPVVAVVDVIVEGPGVQVFWVLSRHRIAGHLNMPSSPHDTMHLAEPRILRKFTFHSFQLFCHLSTL